MKKIKCIIFDCDGVLVDSEPIAIQVLIDMTRDLGFKISLDEGLKLFSGQSLPYCFNHIEKQIGEKLPEDFETTYRKISFRKFEKEIQPIVGVKDFLDSLQDISICVASSGPLDKIKMNLELTKLLHYFEYNIFSCYSLQKWKPEPDIFLHAAQSMGFKIDECIVIEDSEMGIKAALNGGFKTYCYQKDISKHTNEAVHYFNHFNRLKELLLMTAN